MSAMYDLAIENLKGIVEVLENLNDNCIEDYYEDITKNVDDLVKSVMAAKGISDFNKQHENGLEEKER